MVSIRQIFKEMLGQKTRLFLTMLAIAWGTTSITLMLAVGEGMRVHFGKTVSSGGNDILVVQRGYVSKPYLGKTKGQAVSLSHQDLWLLKKSLPDIAAIMGEHDFSAKITYANNTTWTSPVAVSPEFFILRKIEVMPGGRVINRVDMDSARNVVVLGNHVAQELFKNISGSKHGRKHPSLFGKAALSSDKAKQLIGKRITLGNALFTVIGVAKSKMQMVTYGPPDDFSVWVPETSYELLSSQLNYTNIIIAPKFPEKNTQLQKTIRRIIALHKGFDPEDEQTVQFWDSYDTAKETNAFFLGMQVFLGIIGLVTLIVSGVGIANVMYVSVRKATREIGIRMALGARTHHILMHYIVETFVATCMGGAIGFFITMTMVYGLNTVTEQTRAAQLLANFKPVLSVSVLFIVTLALGVIGFIAALFPALSAAKINPVEALQHE